jgi:hypothetical protein
MDWQGLGGDAASIHVPLSEKGGWQRVIATLSINTPRRIVYTKIRKFGINNRFYSVAVR